MIITLTRHGARTPNNDALELTWAKDMEISELTDFGKFQQYLLGQTIRKEYPELFATPLKSTDYYFRSTKRSRTISSAEFFFKGLNNYAHNLDHLKLDQEFVSHISPPFRTNSEIGFLDFIGPGHKYAEVVEPISLFVPKGDRTDWVLRRHKPKLCPGGKIKASEFIRPQFEEILDKAKKILEKIGKLVKQKFNLSVVPDFMYLQRLGDVIASDYFQKRDSAKFAVADPVADYLMNLRALQDLSIYVDEHFLKLAISNLIKHIHQFITEKIDQSNPSTKKLIAYSLHDSNLSPMLLLLDLMNFDCSVRQMTTETPLNCGLTPPYSANMLFEVNQDSSGHIFISTRYNGEYIDLCKHTHHGRKVCKLEQFVEKINKGTYDNEAEMEEFCKLPEGAGRRLRMFENKSRN